MKKLIFLLAVMLLASLFSANALINSCTLNNPSNNQYNNGVITINVTAIWGNSSGANGGSGSNVTNVSITFIPVNGGTNAVFWNNTINGSKTNATAAGERGVGAGDFTFTLVDANLTDNLKYNVYATCYNATDEVNPAVSLNSSSDAVTDRANYSVDVTTPNVIISTPVSGATVLPANNKVTFEYTPTDTNLANCTLSLNNQPIKNSSTSTIFSNITSGKLARFDYNFGNDNSSVRVNIQCKDLAGLLSPSNGNNNFTFAVLTGYVNPAIREAGGGGGGVPNKAFTLTSSNVISSQAVQEASTHIQKYAWIYLIIFVVVIGVLIRKFKK